MGKHLDDAVTSGDEQTIGILRAIAKAAANSQSTSALVDELKQAVFNHSSHSTNVMPRLTNVAAALADIQS